MVKKIVIILLTLLLVSSLTVTAFAHPVPDLAENGSFTFKLALDDKKLDDGKLKLCKVGEVLEVDGDFVFAPIAEFADVEADYTRIADALFAKELLTLAKELELEYITAPIDDGAAVFENVPTGLYVVFQDAADATKGFAAMNPFLISMPKFQDNEYVTQVEAEPKVGLETIPPTTTPPPGRVPQTGQLNWPVPVMACAGAVLFIFGFVLWTGRKRA